METTRRSGNFSAAVWDDAFVQSLNSPYTAQEYMEEAEKLKKEVKELIGVTEHPLDRLQLIDHLQRLDISYHFHDEVLKFLDDIFPTIGSNQGSHMKTMDLCATALQFRLLRQHGYHVPQEVFSSFMDDGGNFKRCFASDVRGLLSLYEASFLSVEGETILDLAKDFATHQLKERLENIEDPIQADEISHALELPVHWRVQKLEARWFINVYECRSDANPNLLQLAKLNFNMVQAQYQNEIKSLSRWYREKGLSEKLGFARHRLAESFCGALASVPQPVFSYSRMILCIVSTFSAILDDIYDVYGTRDELEVFTETIERWDINELDKLPEYMQIKFLAVFNTINEVAYVMMRDQGLNITPHLAKSWAELSKAFHLEARWYQNGYIPGMNEYFNTAFISSASPILLFHAFLCIADPINKEEIERLEKYPNVIYLPSMLLRLENDLATTTEEIKRGELASSIQCYINETGCSEEDAVKHIKQLKDVILKKMNKEILMEKGMGFNGSICETAMNYARAIQSTYLHGDGFGVGDRGTKEKLASLVVEPIPIHPSLKAHKMVCSMAPSVVSMSYPIASRRGSSAPSVLSMSYPIASRRGPLKKQAVGIRHATLAQVPCRPMFAVP